MSVTFRSMGLWVALALPALLGCGDGTSREELRVSKASTHEGLSSQNRSTVVLRGQAMGTTWKVIVPGLATPEAEKVALRAEIVRTLVDLESQLSHWREDSLVSRFNRNQSTAPFDVSVEMAEVVREALRTHQRSDGAFDITCAPLVDRWGFGPAGRSLSPPTREEIELLLAQVGSHHLRLEESGSSFVLRKEIPHLRIDLSALAKGYAIDVVAEQLETHGCQSFLIELGGELRGRGVNPEGNPWRIGLERPSSGSGRQLRGSVFLRDQAIATSGSYRNYVREQASGREFSHLIDPRTGLPVTHELVSVSVIDASAMRADAWATALLVLGPDVGIEVARRERLAASFVVKTADGFVERSTDSFEDAVVAVDVASASTR